MLPQYYFYWFRIDNKHMTEPWLDQALMDLAYSSSVYIIQGDPINMGIKWRLKNRGDFQ